MNSKRLKVEGLKTELSQDLEQRMIEHKARFIRLFVARYKEMLPTLIQYHSPESYGIDFLKMENALRHGYNVVIGMNTNNLLSVMGYTKTVDSSENPAYFLKSEPLDKKDIEFTVPSDLIPKTFEEITNYNNCETGQFVVMKNKTLHYVSDYEILEHYTIELAEIVLSRFSVAIQAKLNTIFKSDVNDQTINELVSALFNGAPYIKVGKFFDPDEQIIHLNNEFMASNFQELKREYQNKMSELNNMLGINSLAVEKSSGVSDTEAKSNRAYTTSNANIYLDARNHALQKLNKRFNTDFTAFYNDAIVSELQALEGVEENENNDYNNGHATE